MPVAIALAVDHSPPCILSRAKYPLHIGAPSMDAPAAKPRGGSGYLSGSYPGGITTVEGVPTVATVRVLYRASSSASYQDGVLVAEVTSEADGTWIVEGLDPAKKYDVVGRKEGHDDVISSNISPLVDP